MKIPRNVSGAEAIKALRRLGFESVRQRGSHHIMKSTSGGIIVVPMHKPIKPGTLRALIEQAGITLRAFTEAL